jgi:hypothetical protein
MDAPRSGGVEARRPALLWRNAGRTIGAGRLDQASHQRIAPRGRSRRRGRVPAAALESFAFEVPAAEDDLAASLRAASVLAPLADQGVDDPQELLAAARAEYSRLLGALYNFGHYGGVITISVDGREAARSRRSRRRAHPLHRGGGAPRARSTPSRAPSWILSPRQRHSRRLRAGPAGPERRPSARPRAPP